MEFKINGGNSGAKIYIENEKNIDGVLYLNVKMQLEKPEIPEKFTVLFKYPVVDCYSVWSPCSFGRNNLGVNWSKRATPSRLASGLPVQSVISLDGKNRLTIALSDAVTPTRIFSGVCEEDAFFDCGVEFFTVPVAPLSEYSAIIRLDTRDIAYYDSIYDVSSWWEKECGYTPAYVPEHARLPMNSLWYTYHQNLDVEDIISECELSVPLGMDTVIIDDGWQTDDNNRGYAFCGDWEVAHKKIPDMKKFVDRIHETGMKVMLWYSVPLLGVKSKNYERFKDMLLDCTGNNRDFWALDPRYKEVRDFLTETYEKAVSEWGLDGLKLDFIDSFILRGKSLEYDEKRDYVSLEDAVDALMLGIKERLLRINPDILIEFRQSYVGPAIRKYGNMLRVADCPNDAIVNRCETVNLRFTSGNTAVHSDMLMWNINDPVESAAYQLISVLFSVPQISVKIKTLPEDHKRMLKFYLGFWRSHRDILLDGKVIANNPETFYSSVWAIKDKKAVLALYSERVTDASQYSYLALANANGTENIIVKGANGRSCTVYNCMGDIVSNGVINGELCEIIVPAAGIAIIE